MTDRDPLSVAETHEAEVQRSRSPLSLSAAAMSALGSDEYQARLRAGEERRLRLRREHLVRAAAAMHIPADENLRSVVLDDRPVDTDALRACRRVRDWRGGRARGCIHILLGPPGVGKTSAACHTLLRHETGGLYVRASHIVESPRTGHSSRDELWAVWRTSPMLVIDELGVEAQHRDALLGLLLGRYDDGRGTIVTSNLTRELVVSTYMVGLRGDQLADRLIRAQGRDRGDGRPGPDGLWWCTLLDGPSLRDQDAVAELRKQQGIAR